MSNFDELQNMLDSLNQTISDTSFFLEEPPPYAEVPRVDIPTTQNMENNSLEDFIYEYQQPTTFQLETQNNVPAAREEIATITPKQEEVVSKRKTVLAPKSMGSFSHLNLEGFNQKKEPPSYGDYIDQIHQSHTVNSRSHLVPARVHSAELFENTQDNSIVYHYVEKPVVIEKPVITPSPRLSTAKEEP